MFDVIIIGAGATGLFCAAVGKRQKGLILESSEEPGKKLLVTGAGQCNMTHGGNIKDFVNHYGSHGSKIRTALYKFNNKETVSFFQSKQMPIIEREDKKIFPECLSAKKVRDKLVELSVDNGWEICTNTKVFSIEKIENGWLINNEYKTQKVIIGTGGCTYSQLGSDGSMFKILEKLQLNIVKPKAALAPINVENYNLGHLSGISFKNVRIEIMKDNTKIVSAKGDLLLTHKNFSGPVILNISRYIRAGQKMIIDFAPSFSKEISCDGIKKNILAYLVEKTGLPSRFIETLIEKVGENPKMKTASVSGKNVKAIIDLIHKYKFSISGPGDFIQGMVTAGGVSLDEINTKTFESKKHEGLFIIGEALDVDGDTGGYNLQFAFSSAAIVAKNL